MPTIDQLPAAVIVASSDEIPLSQGGATRGVTVGTLLAGTQPALVTASGVLLGRVSLGPGGPEPVSVGTGLVVDGGALTATGGDHATFPLGQSVDVGDNLVLDGGGGPRRVPVPALRNIFQAGPGVSIDANGIISAAVGGPGSGTGIIDGGNF